MCGRGKLPFPLPDFIAAQAAQAAIERSSFAPGPDVPGVSSVWEELLDTMAFVHERIRKCRAAP